MENHFGYSQDTLSTELMILDRIPKVIILSHSSSYNTTSGSSERDFFYALLISHSM